MKTLKITAILAGVVAMVIVPTISRAQYGEEENGKGIGVLTVMSGVQGLNKNRTALGGSPFVNIPVAASLAYDLTPDWALSGEFSWLIPVRKSITLPGTFTSVERKTPNILSYAADAVFHLPFEVSNLSPYLTGGLGAMSFLKSTAADRQPQLAKTYTPFAVNFGVGTMIGLGSTRSLALQGDFREFAAFPTKSMVGLSNGSSGNTLWMERVTMGLAYRF
jgi:hypothetical protein